MLADPQVLGSLVSTAPVFGTNFTFPRNGNDQNKATYRFLDADSNDWVLSSAHQYGRTRNRFTIRVDVSGYVPSTLVPSENSNFSQSCYVVFDCPFSGPIVNTTTTTLIPRIMCNIIGQKLVGAVGADGEFLASVVKGGQL